MNNNHYDPQKHHRHSIRLKEYDYSQPGSYFITICTHNRESIFGNITQDGIKLNVYGKIVYTHWNNLLRHHNHLKLGAFAVMPNHIHGILIIKSESKNKGISIPDIIRGFKTFSSRRINEIRKKSGIPVWQRNYWEHVIRNQDSFNRIHDYIMTNPMRWHLDRENPDHNGIDDFDHWLDSL